MDKRVFVLLTLMLAVSLPVRAEVTTADTSSADYLINSGYSAVTAEMVEREKGYANATPFITDEEREFQQKSAWSRFWIKAAGYFDPAVDSDQFMNHDIRKKPDINDL